MVDVRVPEEVHAARLDLARVSDRVRLPDAARLKVIDFMRSKALRKAIQCGGRVGDALLFASARARCEVPGSCGALRAQSGTHSYRNLVSACLGCNTQKGEKPADDFLRLLYRDRRLTAAELSGRVRVLDHLAAGKLRPAVPEQGKEARGKTLASGRLPFALTGALDGARLYRHLALRSGGQGGWVGEFEQFDGRAVFDDERDADAVGWAVRSNQGFRGQPARRRDQPLQRATARATCPDETGPLCLLQTHPLHAEFAFLVWMRQRLSGVSRWVSPGLASVVGVPM